MKLLMENWRKFVNEEEEQLEEGLIGKVLGGLAIMGAGFFGSPAQAAGTDAVVVYPTHQGGGDTLSFDEELKLWGAFEAALFNQTKGGQFKSYDRTTFSQILDKEGITSTDLESANTVSEFAGKLNSNVIQLSYSRTPLGLDVIMSIYDNKQDIVHKQVIKIPQAEEGEEDKSWKAIQDGTAAAVAELKAHHTPPEAASAEEPAEYYTPPAEHYTAPK